MIRLYSIYSFLIVVQISNGCSSYITACVLCSRNVYRAPTTLFSRTSGAWVCPWWKWRLDASLSPRLMLRNWNRFLASQWKGRQPPANPPQSHGPLGDQAAVSLRCDTVRPVILQSGFFFFYYSSFDWNHFRKVCWNCLPQEIYSLVYWWPWVMISAEDAVSYDRYLYSPPQHTDLTADHRWLYLSCLIT